jgi:hypothetical protein
VNPILDRENETGKLAVELVASGARRADPVETVDRVGGLLERVPVDDVPPGTSTTSSRSPSARS